MANTKKQTRGCERIGAAAFYFGTSVTLTCAPLTACESEPQVSRDAAAAPENPDAGGMRNDAGNPGDAAREDAAFPSDAASDANTRDADAGAACDAALETAGVFDLDVEGRSAPIQIALGRLTDQVAIAVEPEVTSSADACYGIEEVSADTQGWVAQGSDDTQDTCLGCAQPVRLHPDQGYFVLPSASSARPFATLSLRVAMRDCATQARPSAVFPLSAPKRVRVRYRVLSAHAPEQKLTLSVGLVVASPSVTSMPQAERAAFVAAVRTSVETALLPALIEVTWHEASLTMPPAKVAWKPEERSELNALFTSARNALGKGAAHAVPLVLAPCLERNSITGVKRPLGTTPHLPGSCQLPFAGVYAAAESCLGGGLAFTDGAALGVIAAHELAHHLGLFHVDEDVLFPSDRQAGSENLMRANPVASLALTPQQVVVLRRHPDLRPTTKP